jgi:hypothetical protein
VLPGAERISAAELAKRRAEQPLKPKARQKPADQGSFSDDRKQTDLVSQLKAAEVEKPTEPDEFDKAFEAALDKTFGKKTPGTAAVKQGRQPQLPNEPTPFTKRARSDKAMSEISKLCGGLEEEEPAQWTSVRHLGVTQARSGHGRGQILGSRWQCGRDHRPHGWRPAPQLRLEPGDIRKSQALFPPVHHRR